MKCFFLILRIFPPGAKGLDYVVCALLSWMKLLKPPDRESFPAYGQKAEWRFIWTFISPGLAMCWFYLYLYLDVRLNAGVTMHVPLMKDGTLTDDTWCIYFSLKWRSSSTNFFFLSLSLSDLLQQQVRTCLKLLQLQDKCVVGPLPSPHWNNPDTNTTLVSSLMCF